MKATVPVDTTSLWLYGASAALGGLTALFVGRIAPSVPPPLEANHTAAPREEARPPSRWWRAAGLALQGASVLACGLAVFLSASARGAGTVLWLWFFSLVAIPVGMNFGVRDPMHLRRPRRDRELAIVVGIILLAAVRMILPGGKASGAAISGPEGVLVAAIALASPPLLYLLARRLFPLRVAAVASSLLAVSPLLLPFAFVGVGALLSVAAPLLFMYMLLRAVDSDRPIEFLLAGFAAGLCWIVAFPPGGAPILGVLYLLHRGIAERGFLREHFRGFAVMALGTLLFLAPTGAYRDLPLVAHLPTPASTPPWGTLLPLGTAVLLPTGAIGVLLRLHRSGHFLVAAALLLGSAGLSVAASPPSSSIVPLLPALCLASALGLDPGWRSSTVLLGRIGAYAFGVVFALLLGLDATTWP